MQHGQYGAVFSLDGHEMNTPLQGPHAARRTPGRGPGRGSRRGVALKRAYDRASPADGVRVLVDRLWPRGLSRDELAVDFWLRDVAPSAELRRWFGHERHRWVAFVAKYRGELARRPGVLDLLHELRRRGRITLLYGARDTSHNHAVVLREVLENRDRRGRSPRTQS